MHLQGSSTNFIFFILFDEPSFTVVTEIGGVIAQINQ